MIKDIMNANENVKPNSREMAVLKENFPSCFNADGSFDLERFMEFLSDKVSVTSEGYELKFLGKNYARLLASVDTTTVVVPDEEHNLKPENAESENIYISGDNLDGLKHLLKSYSGKVKCIYIDPPYNTGTDGFVYKDSFNFTVDELSEKLSISEEQAQRILDLTKRGSASHSAWLMFMYPRLQLARDLLTNDGVIYISIDENEVQNMLIMCNDIFGEENQIAQLIWQKRRGGGNDSFFVAIDHEYILAYARSAAKEIHKEKWRVPYNETYLKRYSETDEIGKRYYWDTLARDGLRNPITLEITAPDGSIIKVNSQKSKETVEREIASGAIRFVKSREGWTLHHRVYQPEGRVLRTILTDVGTYTDSSNEIHTIFGVDVFDYSKPVSLINQLLELAPIKKGDIVVDFFSGSGTTGESVMRNLSYKDLKFIMVQLDEDLYKHFLNSTGEERVKYKRTIDFLDYVKRPHTLDQIGIERIIRAAKAIKEEYPDTTADLGFKHFTLAEPSQNTLDKLEKFDPNEIKMFADKSLLDDFGKPTILATWLVRDGYGLTANAEELDFAGYKGYCIGKHLYLIDPEMPNEAIEEMVAKYETDGGFNPENIVLFGYSFTWTQMEALQVNLKRLKDTEKNLSINFDIRY